MCGIAGIFEFDPGARPDGALVRRMTDILAHRGPDDSGLLVDRNVGLGHRRLSIIDLTAGGHQPMANSDRTIWIIYNGECYNFRELAARLAGRGRAFRSTSDTEVILQLYEEMGEACFAELQGMFALAIWDGRRRQLLLARDRIGIKPLYYFSDARHLSFASELKALLVDPAAPTSLDMGALSDYLHLLSIPDPQSILTGVRKLLPGHYLKVTATGIQERTYWDVAIAPDAEMPFDGACGQFDERFHSTVRSHMIADVPVGAFLSGGVDSSSIVSAASRASPHPIETFSVTFPGLAEFDESPFAAAVAAHCGALHHPFDLSPDLVNSLPRIAWHADEPFAISSAFALYHLAQLARRHVKVVLSGDGSDEIFAGYLWRHVDFPAIAPAAAGGVGQRLGAVLRSAAVRKWLPEGIRSRMWRLQPRDERYVRSFTCFQDGELASLLLPGPAAAIEAAWENNITQRYFETAPTGEQLARKLYTDVKTTLVSEMLTKVDRMTMAHGLEARVPFLDHRLVEWAFTVPGTHKLQGSEGKRLVKKAMERYLPADILYRRKQGFNVPLKVWMRGELKEFVRDHLSPFQVRKRGLFDALAVSRLLDMHFSGAVDASNKIYALLMLELWYRQFMDPGAAHPRDSDNERHH